MRRYYVLPRVLTLFFALRRAISIEPSELAKLQLKRLKALIRHAQDNVPFYHRLFKMHKIQPTRINSLDDLRRIPIVSRKELQSNLVTALSKQANLARCIRHKTSGSSGIPLPVFTDLSAQEFRTAVSLRQFLECGGRLRDKQVQLRGMGASSMGAASGKPIFEYMGILRTEWLTLARIVNHTLDFLKAYQPDVMVGYPSLFQLLAETGKTQLNPRLLFSTGELLSSHCRALVESAFNAKMIDSYGCTEVGDIAWECPDTGLSHINADSVLVEFVRDGEPVAPGEEGEIVLTSLINSAMPFIRYNIGDIGISSDETCPCGRQLPLMELLKGRADDFITLPDGTKLSPLGILNMENFPEVKEYKVIQERRNLVQIWLRMEHNYASASVTQCMAALSHVLGDDVEIQPRIVKEIPRDSSGKLRRIISKVTN
jgi:phenylacetate-CoA ligase